MVTIEQKIERMKAWCLANYESGADTMVECWGDDDYRRLIDDCGGNYLEAFRVLKRVASVYADQQADARYYRQEALGLLPLSED